MNTFGPPTPMQQSQQAMQRAQQSMQQARQAQQRMQQMQQAQQQRQQAHRQRMAGGWWMEQQWCQQLEQEQLLQQQQRSKLREPNRTATPLHQSTASTNSDDGGGCVGVVGRILGALIVVALILAVTIALTGCDGSSPAPPQRPTTRTEPPTTMPTPSSLPDLVLVNARREPAYPLVPKNTTVHFHIQVMNKGNAPYGGFILVRGPGNRSGGFNGLMPGETKTAVVPFVVFASGAGEVKAYDIYFTVDPDNLIKEWNETNNRLGPFEITYY